jgi:hypothetical protein
MEKTAGKKTSEAESRIKTNYDSSGQETCTLIERITGYTVQAQKGEILHYSCSGLFVGWIWKSFVSRFGGFLTGSYAQF